jgi:hypothetical protein
MSVTTDRSDPRLHYGADQEPIGQHEVYLVLSEEERAKGFVRPLYRAYRHVGVRPRYPVRDLTPEEQERHAGNGYVKFEAYPESESPITGRFWTQTQLESGCGTVTTMGLAIAETYARDPGFYGATYCCGCNKHLLLEEFNWVTDAGLDTGQRVGS